MLVSPTPASQSTASVPAASRIARLDVLRVVAVFLVLGRHALKPQEGAPALVAVPLAIWAKVGWLGVDLFFVLSGFLVAGLLFREHQRFGSVSAGRFLIRRGFKIYPAFYAFLALTFFLGVFRRHPTYHELLTQVVFLQNYASRSPGVWDHTWSLAIEEHFYLLLALVAAWFVRKPHRALSFNSVLWLFGSFAVLVLAVRVVTVVALRDVAWNKHLLLFPTHLRIDSLMFGVFLAYLYHVQPVIWARLSARRALLFALAALCLAPSFVIDVKHNFTATVGYTIYYLGFGMLLVAVLARESSPKSRFSAERVLAFVGASSYSIYLWHMAVNFWAHPAYKWATGSDLRYSRYLVIYLGGSVVVGLLMARIIEGPFLKLRDRLFPTRSAPLAPADASAQDIPGKIANPALAGS